MTQFKALFWPQRLADRQEDRPVIKDKSERVVWGGLVCGEAICPAVSPTLAWRSEGGWPVPCCSQTPPAERACRSGSLVSRQCRSRQPWGDTGSAWCGPERGGTNNVSLCFRGASCRKNKRNMSHLEEVDLNGSVGQVQHDGALGAEPQGEIRQTCELVSFTPRNVGTGLQQVLAHVIAEIFQQGYLQGKRKYQIINNIKMVDVKSWWTLVVLSATDLFVESWRVSAHVEVGLSCCLVNVLQTVSISIHDQSCVVVEQHAHAVVAELVAWNTS